MLAAATAKAGICSERTSCNAEFKLQEFFSTLLTDFAAEERGLELDDEPVLPWLADGSCAADTVQVFGSTAFQACVRDSLDAELFQRAMRGLLQQCGAGSGILQLSIQAKPCTARLNGQGLLQKLSQDVESSITVSSQVPGSLEAPHMITWAVRATCPIIFDHQVMPELSNLVAQMNWGLPVGHFNVRECCEVGPHGQFGQDQGVCIEFAIPLTTATPRCHSGACARNICELVFDCVAGAAAVMERYMACVLATGLGMSRSATALSLCELCPRGVAVVDSQESTAVRQQLWRTCSNNQDSLQRSRAEQGVLTLWQGSLLPQALVHTAQNELNPARHARACNERRSIKGSIETETAVALAACTNADALPTAYALANPRAHAPSSKRRACMSNCARAFAQVLLERDIAQWAWDTQEQSIGCRVPTQLNPLPATSPAQPCVDLSAADISFDYCPAVRLSSVRTMLRIEPVSGFWVQAGAPSEQQLAASCTMLPDGSCLLNSSTALKLHQWAAHMNQTCEWGHCDVVLKEGTRPVRVPGGGSGGGGGGDGGAASVQASELCVWFVLASTFPPGLSVAEWHSALSSMLASAVATWSLVAASLQQALESGFTDKAPARAHEGGDMSANLVSTAAHALGALPEDPYVGVASAVLICGFVPLARPGRRHAAQQQALQAAHQEQQRRLPHPRAMPSLLAGGSELGGSSASVRAPPAPGLLCSPHGGNDFELNALASAGNPFSCGAGSRCASTPCTAAMAAPRWAAHGSRMAQDTSSSGTVIASSSPLGSAHTSHRIASTSSGARLQGAAGCPASPDISAQELIAQGSFFQTQQ